MKAAALPAESQAHPVGGEQLKLLYEAIPIAIFATVINGLVLTVVLWNQVPGPQLLGWLAALVLISAGRYVLAHDLSKIEAGRMQLSIGPVGLRDITDTCRSMIEPMARRHGIALHFEMEDCRDSRVLADRTRLLQSLLNLASNAIKYNHAGGSVTLSCEHRPSGRLRRSVQHTGPGIHPERQRDPFQPFSRLGREFSRIEGTGIGLALTRQIVELMQGELGFSSNPGQGSTFRLKFPCADADPADTSAPAGEIASEPEMATLLAIEDNPLNQHMLRQILTRQIPVIAVTAMNPAEAAALPSGGFDAILRKPIDSSALLAAIGQVLERRVAPRVGQP